MGLGDVVRAGERLESLRALRDRLADELDECSSSRDVAALSARLADVLEQIEKIPTTEQVSKADEIAERRAARRGAGSANPARAPRSG